MQSLFKGLAETFLSLPGPNDILSFLMQAYFIPSPSWSLDKMPDMTDKVIIVTGGSAGLGKLTVKVNFLCEAVTLSHHFEKALLERNATVYLAARDEKKSQNVIDEYTRLTGKVAIFLKMDLADLNSVRAAVEEFLRYFFTVWQLDSDLFNNLWSE